MYIGWMFGYVVDDVVCVVYIGLQVGYIFEEFDVFFVFQCDGLFVGYGEVIDVIGVGWVQCDVVDVEVFVVIDWCIVFVDGCIIFDYI